MRKLKLQVQMTVDGLVAGPEGQLDWMTRSLDDRVIARITQLTDTSDTILLGRKMTAGFITYCESVQPESPEYVFARKMVDTPKVVFSKTLTRVEGKNVRVETGDLVQAVNQLKAQRGKDIVVCGGATFVSALIDHDLIDEFNIFVNPVAIGRGMRIFRERKALRLASSTAYSGGVVVNTYHPVRASADDQE
ncbi:MAG TPA: dihydrofolate reductase family protein [Gemmatimonadales bacterium]|nr:dihydrofolate reductase family protein [Gemmatimonadales bacterium]